MAGIEQKIITQVCVMVHDIEQSVARYADILGLDTPPITTTLPHAHTQATYYGEPTNATAKMAIWEIGQLQFELMQPLDGPSSWRDFLEQHGEGIHHIAFFVPKTVVAAAALVEQGYVITQQGLFTGHTGQYTYLDTDKDLGVVIELLEHFGGSPVLHAPPFPAEQGLGTDKIVQVGIIVHDIARTAQRWQAVLGLPQPEIIVTPGYALAKTTYQGQPSEATAKLAFFNLGQVQIELIEPDEKPSIWREFLDRHGEGAHHIAFPIRQTAQVVAYLATKGIQVVQQGLYTDGSGMYTYVESEQALGITIELLESFPR